MSNENCLQGMACPKCGHTESFRISGRIGARVTDNGVDDYGDFDWDKDDYCSCGADECEFSGTVRDFMT